MSKSAGSANWLEHRHASLAERIDLLDSRRALTSEEAMELARLKKEKLRAKDALRNMRR